MKVPDLDMAVSFFEVGELISCKALPGGYANENFYISTTKGQFFLRLCRQQTKESLLYELDLMRILKENSFPTAFPISNHENEFIFNFRNNRFMLYEFKEGYEPKIDEESAIEMGNVIGYLSTIQGFEKLKPKRNTLDFFFVDQLISRFDNAKNPMIDLFNFVSEYAQKFKLMTKPDLLKGLIHGDAFPNNTLFDKDNKLVAIIDFEEACVDNLILDVGMTINGFCFIDNQLDEDLLAAFLTAYSSHRNLTKEEKSSLLVYIQIAAFTMLCWHMRYDLVNTPNYNQEQRVRELMQRIFNLETYN